jgi:hypothetical protein
VTQLSLVRLTDGGRAELAAMEQTFAQALQTHFLDHLSPVSRNSSVVLAADGRWWLPSMTTPPAERIFQESDHQ